VGELNEKLAQAQKQLREQREAAEGLIRQITMERDESRAQLSESEAKAHRLEGQLEMAHERLSSQRAAFQQLVRKPEEERDEIRVEAEARAASLEQELASIRQTLLQERKAAEVMVDQLKAEQNRRKTQLSGFESHLQKVEEQLALAQKQFQDQRETVTRVIQQRAADKEENQ